MYVMKVLLIVCALMLHQCVQAASSAHVYASSSVRREQEPESTQVYMSSSVQREQASELSCEDEPESTQVQEPEQEPEQEPKPTQVHMSSFVQHEQETEATQVQEPELTQVHISSSVQHVQQHESTNIHTPSSTQRIQQHKSTSVRAVQTTVQADNTWTPTPSPMQVPVPSSVQHKPNARGTVSMQLHEQTEAPVPSTEVVISIDYNPKIGEGTYILNKVPDATIGQWKPQVTDASNPRASSSIVPSPEGATDGDEHSNTV